MLFFLNVFCFDLPFDCSCFWTAVTGIATGALVIVGWLQLRNLNRTNKEDFLHKLKSDFFTAVARDLLMLIEHDLLLFEVAKSKESEIQLAIFKNVMPGDVYELIKEAMPAGKREYYTTQEMDDYLLQHLEDVGLLYKKGIVKLYDIEQAFGYYITTIGGNDQIQMYIEYAKQDDRDIYSNLELVYQRLKARTK